MDKTLGQRIRELREALDLSLRDLAAKVDITPPFLSDIELGRRNPSVEKLRAIAKALKTRYEDLEAYDQRPMIEAIKARTSNDPRYGRMLREVVEKCQTTAQLERLLKKG
ncbi:MAG: helix-turn-helix domain-containing protein [Acidobacteriota bacterium]|nr:helix-turn-helix domain-containing protein [Acidobacteriota bacterium]